MLLGGIRYLIPVIEAAHKQGYYVITADYMPDNIAHKYSDEFVNVSVIDKDSVLRIAEKKNIDGIMSFGVDPGVESAAFVQMKLGLPSFGPYESVQILQKKDRFRAFLLQHGFNVPESKGYSNIQDTILDKDKWHYPVIVKPVDSAGSKGVSKVCFAYQLEEAANRAFCYSISKKIIVEAFIEKKGFSSDSDCFLENGKIRFVNFSSQHFDRHADNPYVPAAYTWPSSYTDEQQDYLRNELQRLLSLLNMRTGVYNVESCVGIDGTPYLMEVTPRGGGNRLSEMIKFGTGIDMITACVRDCVGDTIEQIDQCSFNGYWSEIILHAPKNGIFTGMEIGSAKRSNIRDIDLWVSPGDHVKAFNGANDTIGTLVLQYDTREEMEFDITHQQKWLRIKTL